PVPRMPPYVRGMMNLHGAIVPVIDLRLRLGLPEAPVTPVTVIVFIAARGKIAGLVVDTATQAIDIPLADVAPPTEMGAAADVEFIAGLAKLPDRLVVLLDTDALVPSEPGPAHDPSSRSRR